MLSTLTLKWFLLNLSMDWLIDDQSKERILVHFMRKGKNYIVHGQLKLSWSCIVNNDICCWSKNH